LKLNSVVTATTKGTMNGLPAGYANFIGATQSIPCDTRLKIRFDM